jgi:hypothetical protein
VGSGQAGGSGCVFFICYSILYGTNIIMTTMIYSRHADIPNSFPPRPPPQTQIRSPQPRRPDRARTPTRQNSQVSPENAAAEIRFVIAQVSVSLPSFFLSLYSALISLSPTRQTRPPPHSRRRRANHRLETRTRLQRIQIDQETRQARRTLLDEQGRKEEE